VARPTRADIQIARQSWEMNMNWLFEAYSNVYNTAMGQRPLHHRPGILTAEQRQKLKRVHGKYDV
jgi:hypothetical protein